MVTTLTVPADADLYCVSEEFRADYEVGASLLVRVDARRGQSGYIFKYCAITIDSDGHHVIDVASAFEDMWNEVRPVVNV